MFMFCFHDLINWLEQYCLNNNANHDIFYFFLKNDFVLESWLQGKTKRDGQLVIFLYDSKLQLTNSTFTPLSFWVDFFYTFLFVEMCWFFKTYFWHQSFDILDVICPLNFTKFFFFKGFRVGTFRSIWLRQNWVTLIQTSNFI